MSIRYETYQPAHLEIVKRYCAEMWGLRSDAFYEWRFNRCPRLTTVLAMDGDRCAAMASVLHKDYRARGEMVECLEMFDWSKLPGFRGDGIGSSIVKRLMDLGKPVFAFGGTRHTQKILPKMGWTVLTEARVFALPRSGRWLKEKLKPSGQAVATLGGLFFDVGGRFIFRADRPRTPATWSAVPLTSFDPGATSLYGKSQFHQMVVTADPAVLDWAAHGLPRAGTYLYFDFSDSGLRRAFGIARVVAREGALTGVIVDTFAGQPDVEIYRRCIGEMTSVLAGFGVDAIVTTASCPRVQQALKASRFIGGHQHALFGYWPSSLGAPPSDPIHIMRGGADDLFLPSPPPRAP